MSVSKISELKFKFQKMSAAKKRFIFILAAFVLIDLAVLIYMGLNRYKSAVKLECSNSQNISYLVALDNFSRQGAISSAGYANFKFTEEQKRCFEKIKDENSDVALKVRIEILPSKKQDVVVYSASELPFSFGFLNTTDFNEKGKFIKNKYKENKHIQIQGNMKKAPDVFDISFAVQNNSDFSKVVPEGFFIYSSIKCKITAACVVPANVGFDYSDEIPFYGFSCNGGVVNFAEKTFDFSGATMIFPVQSSLKATLPEFEIKLSDDEETLASKEKAVRAEINFGGEKLYVNNVKNADKVIIPAGALVAPFSRVEVTGNKECVTSIIMRATNLEGDEILKPIKTDPGLILKYKQTNWRTADYEIYEWDRYPGILFFDIKDYDIQNNFFRRMAFFVEKAGYKGTLVSDEELEGKHGYNAHDYSAQSMARFFNKATEEDFPLLKEELLLKKILLANGLLENDGDYVKANEGGLVSISRECPDWSRTNLLAHEGWHTLFFRDEEFRNYCTAVYCTFDSESREFLIDYFKSQPSLGYDIDDEYLMHNEFMAYIMQQKLSEVANYFVHLANRGTVIEYTPKLASYIRKTGGSGFEDAAIALNDFVYDKYGIVCGNISLVSK